MKSELRDFSIEKKHLMALSSYFFDVFDYLLPNNSTVEPIFVLVFSFSLDTTSPQYFCLLSLKL